MQIDRRSNRRTYVLEVDAAERVFADAQKASEDAKDNVSMAALPLGGGGMRQTAVSFDDRFVRFYTEMQKRTKASPHLTAFSSSSEALS